MLEKRGKRSYIRASRKDVASILAALTTTPSSEETQVMADEKSTAPPAPQQAPILSVKEWPYLVPAQDVVIDAVYSGIPLGKQRPRFSVKGRPYTPKETKEYEQRLLALFLEVLGPREPDRDSKFALRCQFFRPDRRRIDCDNLMKAVSDAATGFIWKDDSQVMEVLGRLFLADTNPRVEILIYRVQDPSPREKCEVCGKTILTYPSIRSRNHGRFCSQDCRYTDSRVELNCPECHCIFTIPQGEFRKRLRKRDTVFCSRSCCVKSARRKRDAGRSRADWRCSRCNGSVSRPEYKICRACWLESHPEEESRRWKASRKVEV